MITHKLNSQIILGVSFFVFIVLSFFIFIIAPSAGHFEVDSAAYQAFAENFYQNNVLLDPNNPADAPVFPIGYPLFMGLLYKLFGPHYAAIIFAQVILSLLTLVLIFRVARLLFDSTTAYITALLMAINVAFLLYSQMILSEVLLAFFLTFFLERFVYFLKTEKISYLIQAAVLFGCSLLVKSIALFFVVVVLCILYFNKKNLKEVFIFIFGMGVPIFVYMVRTYYVYGVWAITPQAYVNVYHYFLPKIIAHAKKISCMQALKMIPFNGKHSLDASGWKEADQMLWHYVINYPFTCVYIWVQNMGKTLFGLFNTQLKVLLNPAIKGGSCSFYCMQGGLFERMYQYLAFGTNSIFVVLLGFFEALWLVVRYVLVFISCFILYEHKKYTELYLFGFFIFLCTLITGFDGCFRFRMAFEAVLTLLAAYSISMFCKKRVV